MKHKAGVNWNCSARRSSFEVLATAIAVCLVLTAVTCLPVVLIGFRKEITWAFALAVLAFSMLGFVTGGNISDSREPAVAAVMPAALTLVGGIGAFLIGSKGVQNQVVVAALILNFSLALFIGGYSGAELRFQDELSVEQDIGLEKNRHAVDLQRLLNYVDLLKTKHDLKRKRKLIFLDLRARSSEGQWIRSKDCFSSFAAGLHEGICGRATLDNSTIDFLAD